MTKIAFKLGTAAFNLQVESLSADKLKEYSGELFDLWEAQVESELGFLSDYSLYLTVEEGSLKGRGKIYAALGAVYVFISGYGSLAQGVQLLNSHVRSAVSCLNEKSIETIPEGNIRHKFKTGTGKLGKLEGLFRKVREGQVAPEVAAARAEKIFRDEADECPEFIASLLKEFSDQPEVQGQIDLPTDVPLVQKAKDQSKLRIEASSGDTPSAPSKDNAPDKYKVEVWRESKRKKRNIRVKKIN